MGGTVEPAQPEQVAAFAIHHSPAVSLLIRTPEQVQTLSGSPCHRKTISLCRIYIFEHEAI